MSEYSKLKQQIQDLHNLDIRLTAQLEELSKQESVELDRLKQMGVDDLDKAIIAAANETDNVKQLVETSLQNLETASI